MLTNKKEKAATATSMKSREDILRMQFPPLTR